MRTLGVVMPFNCLQHVPEMRLTQQDQVIQRFTDFSNVALGKRIAKGRVRRSLEDLDPLALRNRVKGVSRS